MVFIAVKKDAKLRPPVAQVVIGHDLVAEKAKQPGQGVADDRASQMSHVHGLGDIGRAVVNDEGARGGRFNSKAQIASQPLHLQREPIIAEAQIDKAGAGDFRLFEESCQVQACDDLLGDLARLAS